MVFEPLRTAYRTAQNYNNRTVGESHFEGLRHKGNCNLAHTHAQICTHFVCISVVARSCLAAGSGDECQKEEQGGAEAEVCICSENLCNGASGVYVTSGLITAAVVMAVKLLL